MTDHEDILNKIVCRQVCEHNNIWLHSICQTDQRYRKLHTPAVVKESNGSWFKVDSLVNLSLTKGIFNSRSRLPATVADVWSYQMFVCSAKRLLVHLPLQLTHWLHCAFLVCPQVSTSIPTHNSSSPQGASSRLPAHPCSSHVKCSSSPAHTSCWY